MGADLKGGGVELTIDHNGIGTVTFGHPASNSLPGAVLDALAYTIDEASGNTACKVIVLKSWGDRAFCAGASFDELMAIQDETEGLDFFSGFSKVILAMRRSSKFIICRVQGKAVGGGVGIAAAADYAFATSFSSVKLSELAIGIGPFVVGPAVERKMGTSALTALAIDAATWYDARWAQDQGLYTQVFDEAASMDAAIDALAQRLAASNPEAMAELKRVFWAGTDHWESLLPERAAISGRLVLSDFTREAINRFKGK